MEVQVGPSVITIHADDEVVVCEPDTKMSSTKEQGYFSRDSRFVSGYRIKLGRIEPLLLNSSAVQAYSARFEFTNPDLVTSGGPVRAQTLHLRVDRKVGNDGRRGIARAAAATGECGEQRQQCGMAGDGLIHEDCLCKYLQV